MNILLGKSRFSKTCSKIVFKILRRLYKKCFVRRRSSSYESQLFNEYVEFFDEEANDKVFELLKCGAPCMIAKFGTVELGYLIAYKFYIMSSYPTAIIVDFIKDKVPTINWGISLNALINNAGFFPSEPAEELLKRFYETYEVAIKEIDILGSYIYAEKYVNSILNGVKRVNLDGYYAPFLYRNPWTKHLKGKKVLVVHPFAQEISDQYTRKRTKLWDNPDVLPDFTLITYKAIQSITGEKTEFQTWFDALHKMEEDISKIDFDIALIGCGAYGMPLSAYCKTIGKQSVHLAGWTQVLFGIIGKRWEKHPKVEPYINEFWVRPYTQSVPINANNVEGGCYW